jgi:hypothetical protein
LNGREPGYFVCPTRFTTTSLLSKPTILAQGF